MFVICDTNILLSHANWLKRRFDELQGAAIEARWGTSSARRCSCSTPLCSCRSWLHGWLTPSSRSLAPPCHPASCVCSKAGQPAVDVLVVVPYVVLW